VSKLKSSIVFGQNYFQNVCFSCLSPAGSGLIFRMPIERCVFRQCKSFLEKRPFRFDIRACTTKHYGFEMCSIFEQSVHCFVSLFHWLTANTLACCIIHNVFSKLQGPGAQRSTIKFLASAQKFHNLHFLYLSSAARHLNLLFALVSFNLHLINAYQYGIQPNPLCI